MINLCELSRARVNQDKGSKNINICNTNAAAVQTQITAATATKTALTSLKSKVSSLAAIRTRNWKHAVRAITYSLFIIRCQSSINMAQEAPTVDAAATEVTTVASLPVLQCSTKEKASLTSLTTLLDTVIAVVEEVVNNLTEELSGKLEYVL